MTVSAIFACDAKYGIGKDNDLPWSRNANDMQWFRDNTVNQVVVMGRKTWESIGSKALPKRVNVVITTSDVEGNPERIENGSIISILGKLEADYPDQQIFIIGGANIYRQALPYCDSVYMTTFKETYYCDTFIDDDMLIPFTELSCVKKDDEYYTIMKRS